MFILLLPGHTELDIDSEHATNFPDTSNLPGWDGASAFGQGRQAEASVEKENSFRCELRRVAGGQGRGGKFSATARGGRAGAQRGLGVGAWCGMPCRHLLIGLLCQARVGVGLKMARKEVSYDTLSLPL